MSEIESITSKQELTAYLSRGKKAKFLFFWSHKPKVAGKVDKSCFSQWYPSEFLIDGIRYATAEHFMMAEKARLFSADNLKNQSLVTEIINSGDPGKAKQLGRQVEGFCNKLWNQKRFEIVVKGNQAKFAQNPELLNFLLNTGRRVLVEAAPNDCIWGIGVTEDDSHAENPFKWKGINLLGFALMNVRHELK